MKTVNLEEILATIFDPSPQDCTTPSQDIQLAIILNPNLEMIKSAMKEACRQTLELAAANSEFYSWDSLKELQSIEQINRKSILDTINQIQ